MRKFSRWMPPARSDTPSVLGWIVVILLCPLWICILAVIWPILVLEHFFVYRPEMRRLALDRSGEDIGSFARTFNRRSEPFDPWVIRATWDALGPYVRLDGKQIPLRPTDRLIQDLSIDPEDLWWDLLPEVAERSGHSLDQFGSNPFCDKVETVGDFVRFITWQPQAAKG